MQIISGIYRNWNNIEVLDFIEYLETKARFRKSRDEAKVWSALSLKSAMRGMEEEPSDYSRDP